MPDKTTNSVNAALLNKAILEFFTTKTDHTINLVTLLAGYEKEFFKNWKENVAKYPAKDSLDLDLQEFAEHNNVTIIYNDNDMLILEQYNYSFWGGVHGSYSFNYLCVDTKEMKIWRLEDVLIQDKGQLQKILGESARHRFHMAPTDELSSYLLVDNINTTSNFYFIKQGIVFAYPPYMIAPYADGEINLFVPYKKLEKLLKPEFKKRIGL